MGMAGQTMIHLGKAENPVTKETKLDLPAAKYSIDLLAIIQEKTKGNLEKAESNFLDRVLADLRLRYVDAASGAAPDRKTE